MLKPGTKPKLKIISRFFVLMLFLLYVIYSLNINVFNERVFDENKVYKHIEELSGEKYQGRFAGTEGNKITLSYIESYFKELGVEPGGDNGTYYQNFKDMLPEYRGEPVLNVLDKKGSIIKRYVIGKDYREEFKGYGGNGNAVGGLIPVDKSLSLYRASDIKDKIILSRSTLRGTDIEYAIDSGARGIIVQKSNALYREIPKISDKLGKSIPISWVSSEVYFELLGYANENLDVNMTLDMSFVQRETPNIIGKIEGRKREAGYIIISAAMDGLGKEYNGAYFPGALKNASGTSMMLEMARVLSNQKNKCDKTIVFIGWNNSYGRVSGINYYGENPIYPLEKSQIVILDSVGYKIARDITVTSGTEAGKALLNKMTMNGKDWGVGLKEDFQRGESLGGVFMKKGASVTLIQDQPDLYIGQNEIGTYYDDMKIIDIKNIKRGGELLLSYINNEAYGDYLDMLTGHQWMFLILFLFGIVLLYFMEVTYRLVPNGRIRGFSLEDIYYSTPYSILQRLYKFIAPALIILFLLVFIASIPQGFKITQFEDGIHTNISFFSITKRSFGYISSLITEGFGKTNNFYNVTNVMGYSVIRSLKLLISTMAFSFIAGTLAGILNGARRRERGGLKTLGALIGISLPDVFIVVMIQIILIYFYKHNLFMFLMGRNEATRFIMPFICLSIIPTGYISRLVEVFVREEMKKEYIKAAKAKGLSKLEILKNHILKGSIFKVMDSMQTILTIVISNLIIIEYLFPYPGVAYNIFLFYRENDRNGFMGLVLALGFIYIFLVILFKMITRIINPLKKEGA